MQIFTDLTEYINDINSYGFITHLHSKRNCIYDECDAVIRGRKDKKENIQIYKKFLSEVGMPKGYGLLECNVLVRQHNNPQCIKIMEEWWKEFKNEVKRDQLLLPYILYKSGIRINEIGLMGESILLNSSFRIQKHK